MFTRQRDNMNDETVWKKTAANLLKSEIARAGVSYQELSTRLNALGIPESSNTIKNKLSRGMFSFVFFLQCMKALGVKQVYLGE